MVETFFLSMDIRSLKKWMKDECFNEHHYAIGLKPAPFEGFGLKYDVQSYDWYYTERGIIEVLKTFEDEKEACQYAFKQMKNNKLAKRHLVGFLESEKLKLEFSRELNNRQIEFETDKIHYKQGSYRHRVFVFGCDCKKVLDLKAKYKKLDSKAHL